MSSSEWAGRRIGLIGPLPPPSGGMANQTRQLSKLLAAAGASVTLVRVNAAYRPQWVAHLPILRALFRLVPYLCELWQAAGRCEIFHVMSNSGWSWHLFAAPAVWFGRLRGAAVVINYRGGEADEFLRRSSRLVRFTMRRANALIVPSGFLKTVFARYRIASEIVPNIVDLDRFSPNTERQHSAPHLVVARNLESLYDNETAIRAFSIFKQTFPESNLTIAGSGPEEKNLRLLVAQLDLGRHVRFSGRLEPEEMAALYREADLMLNPSLADNMPNSLLEAWASGLPVVSTNVGGIPYMTTDGLNVSLVPPGEPADMAQACIQLMVNEDLRRERCRAGLLEAQRYTWKNVQPVLLDVYLHAMKTKR